MPTKLQAASESRVGVTDFLCPRSLAALSGATFSDCRTYRYTLWRRWADGDVVAFIGLNPSTADETVDDPTIRRCKGFAKAWGFSGMVMVNLFAFRATEPKEMQSFPLPVGVLNDDILREVPANCGSVVCCWGSHGDWLNRGAKVRDELRALCREKLFHLGMTNGGQPKHPLYLKATTPRVLWA